MREDKKQEVTNMEREYKENKILERMKKIKELSDVIIDIMYGIIFGQRTGAVERLHRFII